MKPILSPAIGLAILLGAAWGRSDAPIDVSDLYRKSYRAESEKKSTEALELMKSIRAKAGDSYFVHVRTGWVAYLAGQLAESEEAYRRAAAADPKAIEPKLGLTLPLLAGKKWRALERACRDVLAMDARNAVARARLAHAYYSLGSFADSVTVYRGLVADYPAELDHQTGLGWALLRQGQAKDARPLFKAVLAISPDNASARQGLGL